MTDATEHDLETVLRDRFGLQKFREGQRPVIEAVLGGRDVLCVMPTGGGKSLCYQLPAVVQSGITLVVSPLIALMKDQVDALASRGIPATLINSTIDPEEQKIRIRQVEAGEFHLVYVAPERFRSSRFLEAMRRVQPALLAIDEAHCISQWGHDFRPDYARIGEARRLLGMPPCIALTATATDLVRRDIADQLNLDEPAQFVTGFDRPNLSYSVIDTPRDRDKLAMLAELINRTSGSVIVYASSRARCESVAQFLIKDLQKTAVVYHAGMTREERDRSQTAFMTGEAQIVVATNAFGMGIDKPDIRSVVHFNYPGTLEAYYQEAGRAGRDGLPAECVLLYSIGDRVLQEMFIENEYPPRDVIHRVYDYLRTRDEDPIELTHAQIREQTGIEQNESAIGTALRILESAGGVERFLPRENMAIIRFDEEADSRSFLDRISPQAQTQRLVLVALEGLTRGRSGEAVYFNPDLLATQLGLERASLVRAIKALTEALPISYVPPFRGNATRVLDRDRKARDLKIDFAALEKRKRREYDKLECMISYARTRKCRRSHILGYFGDTAAENCGRCDNCGHDRPVEPASSSRPIDTEAGYQVILKTLSGVARAKGRVGKNLIAAMLVGSNADKVRKAGLQSLSTFGLLPSYRQPDVVQILDALVAANLVDSKEVESFRPVLQLTEHGRSYLKSPTELRLQLPDDLIERIRAGGETASETRINNSPNVIDNAPTSPTDDKDPLYLALRQLRAEWSKQSGHSPFTIFPNSALNDLVSQRPTTPAELARIKGFGPSRLERFGRAILETIARHSQLPPTSEPTPEANGQVAIKSLHVNTEEWTRRLLLKGFRLEEVVAIRGLAPEVILRHLSMLVRQGTEIPWKEALGPDRLANWSARATDTTSPPPNQESQEWAGLWDLFVAHFR